MNAADTRMEPTLSQTLHLINGATVDEKLSRSSLIGGMLKKNASPEEIVDELYIRTLTRTPTASEKKRMLALTESNPKDRKTYEDIFWGLLNSTEFAFNH